jgi:type VI secretion system protein ImpE
MLADDELRQGNPKAALAHLQEIVRKDPSSSAWRIYLFQLLALTGAWERAATQLGVLADLDPATEAMVRTYRETLRSEALRADIFAGRRTPLIFGEPEPWMAWLTQAVVLEAQGKGAEAEPLRARALEEAPATPGTIDGQAVSWIADADSRLGPFLEAIAFDQYTWVPFCRIREIKTEKPTDLRDLVWTPTEFTWANGGRAVGFIPTRYPGSESSDDGLVQLARKTAWVESGAAWFGQGQRMFVSDVGDHPLLEVRSIALDTGDGGTPETTASGGEGS